MNGKIQLLYGNANVNVPLVTVIVSAIKLKIPDITPPESLITVKTPEVAKCRMLPL